jgi:hypothetical protein
LPGRRKQLQMSYYDDASTGTLSGNDQQVGQATGALRE